MDDIRANVAGCGFHFIPELGEKGGRKIESAQTLLHNQRRHEQPLYHRAAESERRAERRAQPRRIRAIGYAADQVGAARGVSARGRKRSAEVLDERADRQIGAGVRRLAIFNDSP